MFEDEIGLKLIAPPDDWQQRPDMKFTKRLRASIVARARFIEDELQIRHVSFETRFFSKFHNDSTCTHKMVIEDFNHTIDFWIKELERYNFIELCTKPSPNSWSVGQVYMHLVAETSYYIEQMKVCASNKDNAIEEASHDAKTMFLNNDLPDQIIEGAPLNANMPQPASKEQLLRCLADLKDEVNRDQRLIFESRFKGKTKHPGLNYFNASEWLQFAEMHLRHHLRQKKRIDDFLKINR